MLQPIDYTKYGQILKLQREQFQTYKDMLTMALNELSNVKNDKERAEAGINFYNYTIKKAKEFYNITDTTEQIYNNKSILIAQLLNSDWANLSHTYLSTFTSVLQYEKRGNYE